MAEEPVEIDELFPDDDEPDASAILDESTAEIEELDADDDIEVVEGDTPPIGRAWLFDFTKGSFVMDGRSPATVRGDAALLAWVEKCLRTAQGDSVVHPPEFGLTQPIGDYIGGDPDELTSIETDIEEALLFHPDISAVENIVITEGAPDDTTARTAVVGTQQVPSSGATLTVASTVGFPEVGRAYVSRDLVSYSGITATTFTGVSGLPDTVFDGARVTEQTTPSLEAVSEVSFVIVKGDGAEIPVSLELDPEAAF